MNRQVKIMAICLATLLTAEPLYVAAAPGNLSQDPLFIGSSVQPNILFLVDDSGSMDWEVLMTREARDKYPDNNFLDNVVFPNGSIIDFSPSTADNGSRIQFSHPWNSPRRSLLAEVLQLCPGYNAMAYDPNRKYTPWEGDNDYVDQSYPFARRDPNRTATTNVSSHFYLWVDRNTIGRVDGLNECPTLDLGSATTFDRDDCDNTPGCQRVSGLDSDDRANYVNWYTYYRKREFVAKRALSAVIVRSTTRAGLATLHNNNTVGTYITDIDNINQEDSTRLALADASKTTLLNNMFDINSIKGTPLRTRLQNAGRYFEEGVSSGVRNLFGRSIPDNSGRPDYLHTLNNSPILNPTNGGSCQRNSTVLMTDGLWNGRTSPSVGNADGDDNTNFDGGSYGDNYSDTLADVAMRYYERDLATLTNNVRETATDQNRTQHMNTYTIAFGVNGAITDDNAPKPDDTSFNWPRVFPDTDSTIDDLRHTAWNGRGSFLNASDPQTLIDSFTETVRDIEHEASSAAAISFNSTSLDNGALLFRAKFTPTVWSGNIEALPVDINGIKLTPRWNAVDGLLGDPDTDPNNTAVASSREIITYNGSRGVPFSWPSGYPTLTSNSLSLTQVNDLLADSALGATSAETDAYGLSVVNYLRGDASQEVRNSGALRDRPDGSLGDIVHSAPTFVGSPAERYPDSIALTPYSSFVASDLASPRTEMVYVGANDGMLHGFNAKTGAEIFAYMPGFLFSDQTDEGLHYLADQNYIHRSYVDLTPTARDVFVDGLWKTYLVGGARSGGKGIFILDITNPSVLADAQDRANDIVVSEFSDPDLGLTYSQITIAKMNNGEWAAIFGNGYKNSNDNSGDGKAKLFILYLDGSGPGGVAHKELETNVGSDANKNGMSTPEVLDMDGDGTADRIYAGDVLGNMWAFDVSSNDENQWGNAYGNGEPLFVATDNQPITSKPSVVAHPSRSSVLTAPNLMVTFGTGQYLTSADPDRTASQAFYGVWDAGESGLTRDDLQSQTISTTGDLRTISTNNTVDYQVDSEMGWYLDLPTLRERNVVNPIVLGNIVFFNTLIPDSTSCSAGGTGFLMNVSLLNGGQPPFPVIAVQDNTGTYAGVATDGVPTSSTFISNEGTASDADRYVNTSQEIGLDSVNFGGTDPGRTSWTNLLR